MDYDTRIASLQVRGRGKREWDDSAGGLPVYLDLATVMGTGESIEKHLHIKQQGWTYKQMILSLMLLNLAVGDCVGDLEKLEGDDGFCKGIAPDRAERDEAPRASGVGSTLA